MTLYDFDSNPLCKLHDVIDGCLSSIHTAWCHITKDVTEPSPQRPDVLMQQPGYKLT
jgi:hypothetical protein